MALEKEPQGRVPAWTGFRGKTLWHWLKLLGTLGGLFAIASAIILFNCESATQRELEIERANGAALQAYLDQMTKLFLDESLREPFHPLPLRQSSTPDILSESSLRAQPQALARAHTLAALPNLDSERQKVVLSFLHDSGLIMRDQKALTIEPFPSMPTLPRLAILQDANLNGVDLSGDDLQLPYINLHGAKLRDANLTQVTLTNADLSNTLLINATLVGTKLRSADLCGAFLWNADLSGADLSGAFLLNTDLRGANLSNTILSGVKLGNANILENKGGCSALVVTEHLVGTNLEDANLKGANLMGAQGWTYEELAQAYSLVGATMPDGKVISTEEDWEAFKKRYGQSS